jgi:hypothetical protein
MKLVEENMLDKKNIERCAKALFESESHPMLAAAGYATDWSSQPNTLKIDYIRKARTVIKTAIICNYPDCN